MSKLDYTVNVYKIDKRYKTGERLVSNYVWLDRDEATIDLEVAKLQKRHYPATQGYRIEVQSKMITVKNLMTGENIQIDRDTPWCCNPASESFWSS